MDILEIETKDNTYRFYRSIYPPVKSNMYILIEGKEAIVVDSNISEEILDMIKEREVEKVHLFLTHEHYDHSYGVWWFQENFDTILYCHKNCKDQLATKKSSSPRLVAFVISVMDMKDGGKQYDDFKNSVKEYALEPDVLLHDSQTIHIAGHEIGIIHVPGHTSGSCLYMMDKNLVFTGDSMIEGNKIITSFRGGNKKEMQDITLPKLKLLSDDLWILPGHGEPFKKKDFNFDIYNV